MSQVQTITKYVLCELKNGASVTSVLLATKKVLEKYNIESLYKNILQNLEMQLQVEKEKQTFYIDTPYELTEDIAKQVAIYIAGSDVEPPTPVQRIVPELLAGFKVSYSGHVYDASAQKHINKLYNLK